MANKCLNRFSKLLQIQLRQVPNIQKHLPLTKINPSLSVIHCSNFFNSARILGSNQGNISLQENNSTLNSEIIMEEKKVSATEYLENLEPEMQKKLAVIKLEYDVLSYSGTATVPEEVTDEMWVRLLDCLTTNARRKVYRYFAKIERSKKADKIKKEKKKKLREQRMAENPEKSDRFKNTIFLRISDTYMKSFYRHRLSASLMYGTPLIIDLGYDEYMQKVESLNLVKQLLLTYGLNKLSKDPFHIIFCNATPGGQTMLSLKKQLLGSPENFLVTITEQSYLDLYPKEKLVYLSPHAPEMLEDFSFDDVYIVGGFVDKGPMKPVSLAKSKEQKIRCAKFPLDRYLSWSIGNKSLTVDQVTRIMLELRDTGDWGKAFRFVPRRKIVRDEDFE